MRLCEAAGTADKYEDNATKVLVVTQLPDWICLAPPRPCGLATISHDPSHAAKLSSRGRTARLQYTAYPTACRNAARPRSSSSGRRSGRVWLLGVSPPSVSANIVLRCDAATIPLPSSSPSYVFARCSFLTLVDGAARAYTKVPCQAFSADL